MTDKLTIRPEKERDIKQINIVIESAFKNHPYSNQTEHLLVSDLRDNDALSISLVAVTNQIIVGHIAFSEISINRDHQNWYGLAPVSVTPDYQNQGIGSALITEGLDQLKSLGANGCVLVGEPNFYKQFGFHHHDKLFCDGIPKKYFLVKSFNHHPPSGEITYHRTFSTYN
ncbi:N-acetyltransferase [Fodinibius sp. Rm-B-1B1-1]|uniref:GNAT family N-acetyltransferase n=1 Tax=Fodinibius alkaliphilus TaxID=3140241 RepID=UPI003159AF92